MRFPCATRLVVCFQYEQDALKFRKELSDRLGKFSLEVEPSKTRVIKFGRFAADNAATKGERPETFNFLGFTHYCSRSRDGKRYRMKRTTSGKKFTAKVRAFKEWLKKSRTMKTSELWKTVKAKLAGHYAYYGITDNSSGINKFAFAIRRLLFKWLNRRGKRNCLNWECFASMLKRFPLPAPRIKVNIYQLSVN